MNNPQYHYNLFTTHLPHPMFVMTDVNLLEMYKSALVSGATSILWDKGVINLSQVIGIVDITPLPHNGGTK